MQRRLELRACVAEPGSETRALEVGTEPCHIALTLIFQDKAKVKHTLGLAGPKSGKLLSFIKGWSFRTYHWYGAIRSQL